MPNFDHVEAPVKLTAAAVKREALALKKAENRREKIEGSNLQSKR